jgi:uncharacterized protein (DUF1499 family)
MLWQIPLLVAACLIVGGVITLALLSILSRRPDNLGVHDGRLAPCPASPNCVCTRDADPGHSLEPLTFADSPAEAWARLQSVLASWPRTQVVTATETYLHAECTSLLFRFVDDVEFLLDSEAKVIHFRSASRAGRSDLGVNRRRMEEIRQAFSDASGKPPTG